MADESGLSRNRRYIVWDTEKSSLNKLQNKQTSYFTRICLDKTTIIWNMKVNTNNIYTWNILATLKIKRKKNISINIDVAIPLLHCKKRMWLCPWFLILLRSALINNKEINWRTHNGLLGARTQQGVKQFALNIGFISHVLKHRQRRMKARPPVSFGRQVISWCGFLSVRKRQHIIAGGRGIRGDDLNARSIVAGSLRQAEGRKENRRKKERRREGIRR
jgi:hypothetical protein